MKVMPLGLVIAIAITTLSLGAQIITDLVR
jgi:hypothetical protein